MSVEITFTLSDDLARRLATQLGVDPTAEALKLAISRLVRVHIFNREAQTYAEAEKALSDESFKQRLEQRRNELQQELGL